MCHNDACSYFPTPSPKGDLTGDLAGMVFGDPNASKKIAIIPDIYGPGAFYQGFAQYLTQLKVPATVYLVNPFAEFGALAEVTKSAAFERRHLVKDRAFVDQLEAFCNDNGVTGIVGFCLGGFYIYELARRNVSQDLVGFYGFPQGMQNQDPLPDPFDYLADLTKPHLSLMPGQDASVGRENIDRLAALAEATEGLSVNVYEESGHGFLTDIDSQDETLRAQALSALEACNQYLGLGE